MISQSHRICRRGEDLLDASLPPDSPGKSRQLDFPILLHRPGWETARSREGMAATGDPAATEALPSMLAPGSVFGKSSGRQADPIPLNASVQAFPHSRKIISAGLLA